MRAFSYILTAVLGALLGLSAGLHIGDRVGRDMCYLWSSLAASAQWCQPKCGDRLGEAVWDREKREFRCTCREEVR